MALSGLAAPPPDTTEEARWESVRKEFMNDPDQTYLNTGSWGVMARSVFDVLVASLRELELNPTLNRGPIRERVTSARKRLAGLLGADPRDLAFLPNVTVAINTVVSGLEWSPGDEILASDQEYGAIDNCLHYAGRRRGVVVRRAQIPIPPESPDDIVRAFERALTPRTRLLLCSHITTRTGLIAPIRGLADLAHNHGARLAVDGAHAPGMIPLDLREAGCDYYGGNCHKWLCAPKGMGFLYSSPNAQEDLHHLVVSWGYDPKGPSVGPEGRALTGSGPHMWAIEHWGTATMAEQEATGQAVDLQVAIGPDRIAARGRQLAAYIRERIAELPGSRLLSPVHPDMTGSISTFHLQGFDGLDLGKVLFDHFRITVPVYREKTGNVLRVSTHIYNTFEHCDLLAEALQTLRISQAPSSR